MRSIARAGAFILLALALFAIAGVAMRGGALSLLVVPVIVVVLAIVAEYTSGTVGRRRLERFAIRQRLPITAENGNQVIRYLATTRRWRVAGFAAGLVASRLTFAQPTGEIATGADFTVIFVGWVLGALIAEVRAEHLEHGRIRAASLQPRRPERYVRRVAWLVVPGAAALAVATGAFTGVAGVLGWAEPNWSWAGVWLGVALAVAVTVRTIQRAVLRRAQPLAASDVIAADDAIRSRALHVLSGGGAALVLLMVLNQIGSIHLVGVADSRPEQAAAVAEACKTRPVADWRDLLGQVDAVSVAVPTKAHREVAGAFLARGIPTLVEKPLAATLAEAEELVALADRHATVLQVGHIERFNPALSTLDGLAFRPKYIAAERMGVYTFRTTDIGVVLDLMIHDIDLVLSLVHAPVKSVSAVGVGVFGIGGEDVV